MMNNRAFTLVEILVAIMIFSLLLLPLTGVLIAESRYRERYERKIVAMLVAKNELERSKKMYAQAEGDEYTVTMAGRVWNVTRTVVTGEGALLDSMQTVRQSLVTIGVTRENDTLKLAEFSMIREIWR